MSKLRELLAMTAVIAGGVQVFPEGKEPDLHEITKGDIERIEAARAKRARKAAKRMGG